MFDKALEHRIFSQAVGFHRIAHEILRLKDNEARDVSYIIAGIVNSAFASELYLKCLVVLDSGKTVKMHDLHKLYKQLNPTTRDEIEKRFDALSEGRPVHGQEEFYAKTGKRLATKFKDIIAISSQGFVEWRYLYEDSGSALEYGLIQLPDLLSQIIVERKPDWRKGVWALKTFPPQPTSQAQKKPEPVSSESPAEPQPGGTR